MATKSSSARGSRSSGRESRTAARGAGRTAEGRSGGSSGKSRKTAARGTKKSGAKGGSRSRAEGGTSRAGRASSAGRSSGAAHTTQDHEEIRRWAEDRGGSPASVAGTERGSEAAGMLRIDFPGYSGEHRLEHISWEEFFEKFDEAGLAFLYQERAKGGQPSRFFKLITAPGKSRGRASRRNPMG